ncbi:MAG: SOS response-associated peptidase [Planctomycetaceae bacterium]
MCGRFTLATPASKLMQLFHLPLFPDLIPRYNIAPTQLIACVRVLEDVRQAVQMRWGLVPSWATDLSIGSRMINARSETVAEKPSFRKAFAERRCLIPADGFFEWEKTADKRKQPWLIHLEDHQPFAFAGLWERWRPRDADRSDSTAEVLTCTILTTSANADMSPLHDRMPVILSPEDYATWLSHLATPGQLNQLMTQLPEGRLHRYPVSPAMNRPSFDSPENIQPLN